MGDPKVLKGVYKDGGVIASVIQQDDTARVMVKGAEPSAPGDAAFVDAIRKILDGVKEHIDGYEKRELNLVFTTQQALAENLPTGPEELKSLGLSKLTILDGDCGIAIRMLDTDPNPTALAYASLVAAGDLAPQPGLAEVPENLARKVYRDLTDPQKKVFEAAAQVTNRLATRLLVVDDGSLKMLATLTELPPARARTIVIPLGAMADRVAGGTDLGDIAKEIAAARG